MPTTGPSYEALYQDYTWPLAERYNIAVDVCDRHADSARQTALIYEAPDGRMRTFAFGDLREKSNRLANALKAKGLGAGDRLGILLPQRPETALAHLAIYKLGGIAVPLFTLFGMDALEYRLADCGAKAVVTDTANLAKLMEIRPRLPRLKAVFVVDDPAPAGNIAFWEALEQGSASFSPAPTRGEDPALLIYTSGTTGPPKGALHAHRSLLGHLPGVALPHNLFPQPGDRFWTPADWAWIGGLMDVLLPSWHHGVPVVAYRARKFDPEFALHFMAKHQIRNVFLPPTALKLVRQARPETPFADLALRSVGSGGETLGQELLEWGRRVLGVDINEFYGQTEANLVVGNCADLMPIRPGSMGRPIPGHQVEIVDDAGEVLPAGATGNIAVRRPDPVMFLEYWRKPEATAAKFVGDWCLTGDTGKKDPDGYLWFVGRQDDLITSAGYRIGPGEIEDCLLRHPAIALAAVVGVPDPIRTEIVKAFIVLKPGEAQSPALADDIKAFVRNRLAAHEYPRQIEFIDALPLTATGKIIRRELRQRT
jgi:acetyl-CoA synthetase